MFLNSLKIVNIFVQIGRILYKNFELFMCKSGENTS